MLNAVSATWAILNPILNGVYIKVEVSFHILTSRTYEDIIKGNIHVALNCTFFVFSNTLIENYCCKYLLFFVSFIKMQMKSFHLFTKSYIITLYDFTVDNSNYSRFFASQRSTTRCTTNMANCTLAS